MGLNPQGEDGTYLTPGLKTDHIWPHHRKMIRLFVSGCTPGEIQSLTGFSPSQITKILASPHIQAEINRLVEISEEIAVDVNEDLKKLSGVAVEVLSEDLNMEVNNRFERKLRQDAAKDILDRAGFRKNTPFAGGDLHLHQHIEKEAKEMSDRDLQNEVMDLVKVSEGNYQ